MGGVEAEKQMVEHVFDYSDLDHIKMMSVMYSNSSHLSSLTDVLYEGKEGLPVVTAKAIRGHVLNETEEIGLK